MIPKIDVRIPCGRFGMVAVTADWLIGCAREGVLLSTAAFEPPAPTEALYESFPVLKVTPCPRRLD